MNKPTAVFPGSFDPFTRAHLELVRNAGKFFDITILICQNSSKAGGMFTPQQRKEIIDRCISDDEKAHVKVEIHEGLVSDYCAANDIKYIIRGIQYKNAAEEIDLAHIWYQDENIKTVFFPTYITDYEHVSSSRVREYIKNGSTIWVNYVPEYCTATILKYCEVNKLM